ncbi:hypothetical protein [Marinomonas algarum]|uniref:LPS-assembly lipoprotein LptE n=1 Tax=Marinomonas algarum TaxID=2883105 RepID=A0A9X1ILB5_9GAMM|nr:hypothetical protein [Marinomonas algarum]MCB5161362.1 hypothetical protein [Marinomonas algarum]
MSATFTTTTRFFALILLSLSIVACGFQLRGAINIPERLQTLTLTSASGSDTFDRALRIALEQAGVTVIDQANATKDTFNLKINNISSSDVELARNSDNDVSQVQRTLSSQYFVRDTSGKAIYGPRTISTSQTLTNQDAEASSKASYNQAQTEKMSETLADQLLYDLNYAPR